MHPVRPLALAALVLVPACTGGASPGARWAGTVDTLGTGAVRVVSPDAGVWREEERWRLEEELRLGAVEGGGPEVFGDVRGLAVDGAGRVHVLDGQATEIRTFGADGTHVRSFGREGEGPGEMRTPFELALSPEQELWVLDLSRGAFLVFDTAGLHRTDLARASFDVREPAFLDDGDVVDVGRLRTPSGSSTVLVRGRVEGGRLVLTDTVPLPTFEGEPRMVRIGGTAGGNSFSMAFPIPFQPVREWLVTPDGLVISGDGTSDYRVLVRTLAGDTVRIVERAYEPVPVTDDELRGELRRLEEAGAELDPDEVPDAHPPFEAIHASSDGHLWVRRRVAEGGPAWEVFDPEGRFLGRVRVPDAVRDIRPEVIGPDALWGTLSGPFDEPYVVRLGIRRGSE